MAYPRLAVIAALASFVAASAHAAPVFNYQTQQRSASVSGAGAPPPAIAPDFSVPTISAFYRDSTFDYGGSVTQTTHFGATYLKTTASATSFDGMMGLSSRAESLFRAIFTLDEAAPFALYVLLDAPSGIDSSSGMTGISSRVLVSLTGVGSWLATNDEWVLNTMTPGLHPAPFLLTGQLPAGTYELRGDARCTANTQFGSHLTGTSRLIVELAIPSPPLSVELVLMLALARRHRAHS